MNVLFLTIADRFNDLSSRGIYKDLMRKFRDEGHTVFVAAPTERRNKEKTHLLKTDGVTILKIRTLNITRINRIEKGLATLLIDNQFYKAIKRYFSGICFELVLYSTPPVTFAKVIQFVKHRDKALCYLLLKDIFPQNAVDLGLIRKDGLLHSHFRKKEKELYAISDFIGCMSPANVHFIRKNNPDINPGLVEVNPNSIEPEEESLLGQEQRVSLRKKYKIPLNETVFIFGGNLGKPQGIDFLLETLDSQMDKSGVFFIVSGSGTEFLKVKKWFNNLRPKNALLLSSLPKIEFNNLVQVCDVGMIFLDNRFTIPNFPSRLLSYMEFRLPVIAATDKNTDLGKIMEENAFGIWSEAGDLPGIIRNMEKLSGDRFLCQKMGQNGFEYLLKNYTVTNSYSIISKHFGSV